MNRIFSIGLLLLWITPYTYSQTYYYQLNKIASDNVMNVNVTGGQFITFMADICYESTAKGLNVGHGKLTRRSSNNQFKEYRGDSYWGTATFKFKSDLSKLNVITDNGDIWVYTRTTAPESAKTCSLIRKGGNNDNSNDSNIHNSHQHTINNNITINNNYEHKSSIEHDHKKEHSSGTWITKQCTACNGAGKSIAKEYPPYYGGTRTKDYYCNICNGYDYPHSHKTCGICNGKGHVKEYKY